MRTTDDGESFVRRHLAERRIPENIHHEAVQQVHRRAEAARTQFKKRQAASIHESETEPYKRRLANNRRSAAASRVYHEISRREGEALLVDLDLRGQETEKRFLETKHKLNAAMRAHRVAFGKLTRLQNQANSQSKRACNPVDDDGASAYTPSDVDRDAHLPRKRPRTTTKANIFLPLPAQAPPEPTASTVGDVPVILRAKLVSKGSMFPYLFGSVAEHRPLKIEIAKSSKKPEP